jgi:hypothetical protein
MKYKIVARHIRLTGVCGDRSNGLTIFDSELRFVGFFSSLKKYRYCVETIDEGHPSDAPGNQLRIARGKPISRHNVIAPTET